MIDCPAFTLAASTSFSEIDALMLEKSVITISAEDELLPVTDVLDVAEELLVDELEDPDEPDPTVPPSAIFTSVTVPDIGAVMVLFAADFLALV